MTLQTHRISPTARVRCLVGDAQTLVLREELRQVGTGRAWCILSCSLIDRRRWSCAWPAEVTV